MADIIPFKKPSAAQKNKGKTLCKRGFHQWVADRRTPFDSQQGSLITRHQCQRCGKTRISGD